MLRLLGNSRSINVRKVLWTCDEIGLEYQLEPWGAGGRSTEDPAFRAMNPKGLVPVLVDGDVVLTESNTIARYLAATHGRTDLLPSAAAARARVEECMDWQATEFNAAWRLSFQVLVRGNRDAGTTGQVARSLADWTAMVGLLDARLEAGGPYACGDRFTLADIVLGLSANRWDRAPIERRPFPAVQCYLELLRRRPQAAPHLGEGTD